MFDVFCYCPLRSIDRKMLLILSRNPVEIPLNKTHPLSCKNPISISKLSRFDILNVFFGWWFVDNAIHWFKSLSKSKYLSDCSHLNVYIEKIFLHLYKRRFCPLMLWAMVVSLHMRSDSFWKLRSLHRNLKINFLFFDK